MIKIGSTVKKLTCSIVVVIILTLCLCVTSIALIYSIVEVRDNEFITGEVRINLNDSVPIIAEHEFLFEPGMTVVKDFFIENQSTCDVYYKLFFDDIEGGLSSVLDITITDGSKILYSGKMTDMTETAVSAADDVLGISERRDLTIYFHFPKEAGNDTQGLYLSFTINAKAVQTQNNENKEF